jgi:hypothetical protein
MRRSAGKPLIHNAVTSLHNNAGLNVGLRGAVRTCVGHATDPPRCHTLPFATADDPIPPPAAVPLTRRCRCS